MKNPFASLFRRNGIARSNGHLNGNAIRSSRIEPEHAAILRNFSLPRQKRMYEAAITTNLNLDYPISIASADSEIQSSLVNGRARARTCERDNPYAKSVIQTFLSNVGGHEPFRLESNVGTWQGDKFIRDNEINRKIEDWWGELGRRENCTVRRNLTRLELYVQTIAALIRDGGILFRHHRLFRKNRFGYAIEPLETDRLDVSYNSANFQPGQPGQIRFSIEMDEYNAPQAYWLLARHPGDYFAWNNDGKYRERVPAENIIALFDFRTRAEQSIGMPRLASILQHLHQDKQFDLAHVTAATWAACKPFFIKRNFPTAMEVVPDWIKNAMTQGDDGSNPGDKYQAVEPGTGQVLEFGEEPVLMDPKFPIESATSFKKDRLRAVSAGSGAPYFHIAHDLESVNFSSGRLGLEAFHDECKMLQQLIIQTLCIPWFETAIEYSILSGALDLPAGRLEEYKKGAHFYGRRWPYIQPLQDAQADEVRLRMGTVSREEIRLESDLGGDVEEVDAKIANEQEVDEAHGLDFTHVYGAKNGGGLTSDGKESAKEIQQPGQD